MSRATSRTELHRVAARRSDSVPTLRDAVVAAASEHLGPSTLDDVALVVSELLTNALRHSAAASDITVDVAVADDQLVVTVENAIDGTRPPAVGAWRVAAPDAPRGRGLGIVRELAPGLAVADGSDHVAISVSWPVDP